MRITIISILSVFVLSFNVINNSNLILIFLYFWVFGNSLFGFGLFIQSFFSRARIAALCGTLMYFGTSFLNIIIADELVPEKYKYVASLFSTVAVVRGAETFSYFEI